MKRTTSTVLMSSVIVLLTGWASFADAAAGPASIAPNNTRGAAAGDAEGASIMSIIETGGLNVLHEDFALAPGDRLRLPPGMPRPRWVSLPRTGTFEDRVEEARSGPLGHLQPGELYWIRGTRIGIFAPPDSAGIDIFANRAHATGTMSSAVGRAHGTNPDGLAVFIPDQGAGGWSWLVEQDWIDLVSTSYVTGLSSGAGTRATCPEAVPIKAIAEKGRMVFSSSGNAEHIGAAFTPSGSPHTYQVGGVDSEGRTYVPGPSGSSESVTPTRGYETGDRFEYLAADPDSLAGSAPFGGTSGASPSTAARAASLLEFARSLVDSPGTGVREGALVTASRGALAPDRGPLRDGRLTRDELTDLLHHVAIPAEPPSPGRYLVEGYGALNERAIHLAERVLQGAAEEPRRPEEDFMYQVVEQTRAALFPSARCG